MATRLRGSLRSLSGDLYQVFLDQESPQGGGVVVDLVDVRYRYKANNDDIDANFLLSTVSVTILVKSLLQQVALQQFLDGSETRNKIRILKNGELEYLGIVFSDLLVEEDRHFPRQVTLEAADGIGRLKAIQYIDEGLEYDNTATIVEHINAVLIQSGIANYYAAGDEYFRIHTTFWPNQLTPNDGDNALEKVRINYKAFREVDTKGNVVFKSGYDVLLEICKAFNFRFFFSEGVFWFSEIADYDRQDAPIVYHRYSKSAAKIGTQIYTSWEQHRATVGDNLEYSQGHANAVNLSGGTIGRIPPLRSVEFSYKHFSRQNLLPGRSWTQLTPIVATLFNFRSAPGLRLKMSAVARGSVSPPLGQTYPTANIAIVLSMRLWVDGDGQSRALTRNYNYASGSYSYTPAEWVAGGGNTSFPIVIPVPFGFSGSLSNFQFGFTTPDVPISGDLKLNFFLAAVLGNGSQWQGADAEFELSNVFLESLVDGSIASQFDERRVTVLNEDYLENSRTFEREIMLGDGTTPNSFGRMEVQVGAGFFDWELTEAWHRYAGGASLSGSAIEHIQLLAKTTLGLQDRHRQVLQGSIIAPNFYPSQPLLRANAVYVVQQCEKSIARDEWRGKWVNISFLPRPSTVNIEDIAIANPEIGIDNSAANTDFVPPPGTGVTGTNTTISTTSQDIPPDVEITNPGLAIPPSQIAISAGDILTITNPATGETQTIVVANDYSQGANNPWIDPDGNPWITPDGEDWIVDSTPGVLVTEPFTPTIDFPAGSYVQPDPVFVYNMLALARREFERFDLFSSGEVITTGVHPIFWRPTHRIGWTIEGISFAVASNPSNNTISVAFKHTDLANSTVQLSSYSGSNLSTIIALNSVVQAGVYFFEVTTAGATGLQIILKLRKNIINE